MNHRPINSFSLLVPFCGIGASSMPHNVEGSYSFSPDGKHLAGCTTNRTAQVWEVETGKVVHTFGPFEPKKAAGGGFEGFGGSSRSFRGAYFSPDGNTLAVADDMVVHLFDLKTNKEAGKLDGKFQGADRKARRTLRKFDALAFSADGKRIVTTTHSPRLMVWDRQTFQVLHGFPGFENEVHHVAISPDGSVVAGTDYRGNIKLWNVSTGKALPNMPPGKATLQQLLHFVDGGKTLLSISNCDGVRWDVENGKLRQGNPEIDGQISISPDGTLLISRQVDSSEPIVFWDRKLGKPIGKMPGIPARMASSSLLRITACLHTLGPTVRYDAGKSLPGKRSHDKDIRSASRALV